MRTILRNSRSNAILSALKRTADIIGSTLVILLQFPLICLLALLVKLTSKGPVLFKQTRIGLLGRRFTILRFRSMYVDNDPKPGENFIEEDDYPGRIGTTIQPVYTMKRDPRVTPLGRFLRRTSLDELPQLFNVLKGDMSLVGPRPLLEYEYKKHEWSRSRLELKPGITILGLGRNAKLVSHPPGSLLGQWAEWFLSPKTVQYVVDPILSDLQTNYFDALAHGQIAKASWVRLRGYWELFKAVGLVGVLRTIVELWKSVR